jgi:hypothetical protein
LPSCGFRRNLVNNGGSTGTKVVPTANVDTTIIRILEGQDMVTGVMDTLLMNVQLPVVPANPEIRIEMQVTEGRILHHLLDKNVTKNRNTSENDRGYLHHPGNPLMVLLVPWLLFNDGRKEGMRQTVSLKMILRLRVDWLSMNGPSVEVTMIRIRLRKMKMMIG